MTAQTDLAKKKKSEILDAYYDLLKKMEEKEKSNVEAKVKRNEEKKVIARTDELSTEKIVQSLTTLKLEMDTALGELEQKLSSEYKRFADLQQACRIQTEQLESIHEISVNVHSLAALVTIQEDKQTLFQERMEKEEQEFEETIAQRRQQWQREEEEYTYQLQLQQKRDHDTYESQKQALEQELTDKREQTEQELFAREQAVNAREAEFNRLNEEVAQFSEKLHEAVEEAKQKAVADIQFQQRFEKKLLEKEIEGKTLLLKQQIQALEAKLQEKNTLIQQLTQKADKASHQVEQIAVAAIEGASARSRTNNATADTATIAVNAST